VVRDAGELPAEACNDQGVQVFVVRHQMTAAHSWPIPSNQPLPIERLCQVGPLPRILDTGYAARASTAPLRGAPARHARKALNAVGQQLLAAIDVYLADPTGLDDAALTRLCFVAGFFEDIARTGEIRRFSTLTQATLGTCLDDLTSAVPTYVVTDIDQQVRLADNPFAPSVPCRLPPASAARSSAAAATLT
jgi:hypothetical protein